MGEYLQTDSLLLEDAETSILGETDSVASQKDTVPALSENVFQPSYIFQYDTLSFKYSLDSTAMKAYKVDLSVGSAAHENGFTGNTFVPRLKHQDGVFLSLLFCLFVIANVIQRGHHFFLEGFRFLFTFREKKDEFDEITIKEFWGNLFLLLLPAFLISLLTYQYLQNNDTVLRPPHHLWLTIAGFTIAIVAFISLKYLFYLILGYTFDVKEDISTYLKAYLSVNELFGVLIFIPALVYLYSPHYSSSVLFIIVGLFIITRIILYLRLLSFFLSKKINFLFGILYLCSVEIPPYIFFVAGFVFTYKEDFFCVL